MKTLKNLEFKFTCTGMDAEVFNLFFETMVLIKKGNIISPLVKTQSIEGGTEYSGQIKTINVGSNGLYVYAVIDGINGDRGILTITANGKALKPNDPDDFKCNVSNLPETSGIQTIVPC